MLAVNCTINITTTAHRLSDNYTIEPVMLTMCLIAGLIFGINGAILVAVLFGFMMFNNAGGTAGINLPQGNRRVRR